LFSCQIKVFGYTPLSLYHLFLNGAKASHSKNWPTLKDKPTEEMYLSFTELDTQKLKHIRKLLGCHFSTLLGVIQAEASTRFLNINACEVYKPNKFAISYPVAVPGHPVVSGGPLQNHL